ncbi:kinase-like domain-containing protein, partial [Mycena sanguinolenta]
FCREALVWKELCHPYILPFLGIEENSFPSLLCMVSPWMEHGTVLKYLEQYGHRTVDKLLYEIAQGLQYLHSRNIVHGDLRGANILINEDWNACLADFGLSFFSDATSSISTNRGGSVYWMAPELLNPGQMGFARTPASDVYAFGCVCFELYTGRPPFSGVLTAGAMLKVVIGERPPRPSSSPAMSDVLWSRVSTYWAQDPTTRPATHLVVQNMIWPPPLAVSPYDARRPRPPSDNTSSSDNTNSLPPILDRPTSESAVADGSKDAWPELKVFCAVTEFQTNDGNSRTCKHRPRQSCTTLSPACCPTVAARRRRCRQR